MTTREEIKKIIKKTLHALQKSGVLSSVELPPYGRSPAGRPEIKIEYPADSKLGDYATNIAFILSKNEKQKPFLIAQMVAEKIMADKNAQKMLEKVEAAGAGFINFTLSPEFLQYYVGRPTSHINVGKGRKLNIEFLSANPTGKFQVGNGRIGFYGDALGNIFKLAGYKVTKEYYVNNAKNSNQIIELGKTAFGAGEKYLTPYLQEKINEVKKSPPYEGGARGGNEAFGETGFLLAGEIQKDNQQLLEKIGIHYDAWTREQEDLVASGLIQKTLALLTKKGLVYEKEGAQWLKTTKFGDDKDKVIVRSSGEFPYAKASGDRHGYYLSDIAYHQNKIKRGYKVIIDIFGADHQGHVTPMKVAMKILGYKGKFDILTSQLVQAKGGGKFSKRAGNVVELTDLVDEVGVDVARYFYLMKSLDTQMEFDLDLARDQSEKNPVYYVQYAHARMASILRKSKVFPTSPPLPLSLLRRGGVRGGEVATSKLTHPSEFNLIKHLLRWPEVVEDTAYDYEIQRVTGYAYNLATAFSRFYRDCKVISEDKNLTKARLGLVIVTQKVLKEALGALGISAPEKM